MHLNTSNPLADVGNRNRQPAGVSTGGQFAVEPRTETDLELDDTAPVALSTVVPAGAEEELLVDEFEHGDPTLATIRVTATDDGFHAEAASQPLGFIEGLAAHADTLGLDAEDEDAIESYLSTRELIVTEWLQTEYGIDRLETEDWYQAQAYFIADLPVEASTADIVDAVREQGKPVELYNESDPGTYGARNMWRVLAEYLGADDERAKTTTTTITWARRYPAAHVTETWTAQVPISLLRKASDDGLSRAGLDQYVCDNGQPVEWPEGDRSGRDFDELRYDFADHGELLPAYRSVPEQGQDAAQ